MNCVFSEDLKRDVRKKPCPYGCGQGKVWPSIYVHFKRSHPGITWKMYKDAAREGRTLEQDGFPPSTKKAPSLRKRSAASSSASRPGEGAADETPVATGTKRSRRKRLPTTPPPADPDAPTSSASWPAEEERGDDDFFFVTPTPPKRTRTKRTPRKVPLTPAIVETDEESEELSDSEDQTYKPSDSSESEEEEEQQGEEEEEQQEEEKGATATPVASPPAVQLKKKGAEGLKAVCKVTTPHKRKDLTLELKKRNLNMSINVKLLHGFLAYLNSVSRSKTSGQTSQVVSVIAKFLYFAGCRESVQPHHAFDREMITLWIEAHLETNMAASTICNRLGYLENYQEFCTLEEAVVLSPEKRVALEKMMKRQKKKHNSEKRAKQVHIKDVDSQPEEEVYDEVLNSTKVRFEFGRIYEKVVLSKIAPSAGEYLTALRVALMSLIMGNMQRPMPVYELTTHMVDSADWEQDIVVLRNHIHKTGEQGTAKICLSGALKNYVARFREIRRLMKFPGGDTAFLLNTSLKPLVSSSLNEHLKKLQQFVGLKGI